MSIGWTGGQYSLIRASLGTVLAICLLRAAFGPAGAAPSLIPWWPNLLALSDSSALRYVAAALGGSLALLFAAGWWSRPALIGAAYLWICFLASGVVDAGPTPGALLALVLLHSLLPSAPYGSVAARGRVDPDGGWRFPPGVGRLAWVFLIAGHIAVIADRLSEPHWRNGAAFSSMVEQSAMSDGLRRLILGWPEPALRGVTWAVLTVTVLLLPLCLPRRSRPWAWLGLFLLQIGILLTFRSTGSAWLLVVLHVYAFDPAWIRPSSDSGVDRVFYDGTCGLCHRSVRFLLAEDRGGARFRYAPLQGESFARLVPQATRRQLPDSIVLLCQDGRLLTRAAGVLHALRRLGGLWRIVGGTGARVPAAVSDRVYDLVAAVRHRIFRRPVEACPITPPPLRSLFDE